MEQELLTSDHVPKDLYDIYEVVHIIDSTKWNDQSSWYQSDILTLSETGFLFFWCCHDNWYDNSDIWDHVIPQVDAGIL